MLAVSLSEAITDDTDALPPPDPLTPFAVLGGPAPDGPFTDAHLAEACQRFCAFYGDPEHAAIRAGAQKALAALVQRDRWHVLADGALELRGSSGDIYLVSDEACRIKGRLAKKGGPVYCPSFRFGQRRHGGQCYHLIARELLRLAQALAQVLPSAPAEAPPAATHPRGLPADDLDPDLAFVTLSGVELAAACLLAAHSGQPVRVSAVNGTLQLRAGARSIRLDAQDGAGVCALTITAHDFAALWDALRPIAHELPAVQVFIDRTLQTICLCAEGDATFAVSVPSTST